MIKDHTFGFGFVNLYGIGFLPLLNPFFVLLQTEATSFTPAKIWKMLGFFCSLSAICSALYPLLCIHPEIHSQIFGNANKLCSPFLISKRPHTTQYFLLYLCSQSCTCISKDNRFVLSKVKCFQAIALALVLPPSRCMNIFPVLLLQIRTCILLNRANKFQTQILETVMRDWQNWIKPK